MNKQMTKTDRNNHFFDVDLTSANLKEKSIRGGLFTISFQAVESMLRIGSIAILARILIPENFGLISMVTAIIAIAERFQDLGLHAATVQKKDITHEQISKLFWINAITGFGLTVLISSMSFLIARFFNEPRLISITIAIATSFFWIGLTMQHQAILRRQMKYAAIGGVQLGSIALSIAIAIVLAVEGYGYWALVWREVSRNVFIALGTWMCCPWTPGFPRKHINIDHLIKFGRDLTGFNVIVFLTANLDQILIGKLYGPAQLGIYRQAYQLIFSLVMQVVSPVIRVAEPTLSFLQNDAERYRKYYQKIVTTVNVVMMPLIMFLVIYSHEIVLVMLGEKWVEATDIFRILAISAFIAPASDSTGFLLVTCGKTKRYLNLGLITGVILALSFGIGVVWGALGVAYGYLVATYTLLALRSYYSFEGTPVSVRGFWEAIEKPLLASLAMTIGLVIFNKLIIISNPLLLLVTALPVATVAYLLAWMIMPGGKGHLREVIYDLITPLYLDKYIVAMSSRR